MEIQMINLKVPGRARELTGCSPHTLGGWKGKRPTVPVHSFLATGKHLEKYFALLQLESWLDVFWFLLES